MEGNSFHFLMNLCWYYIIIAAGVTASFSLNFLNSLLLLNVHVFSADTKHEKHFKIPGNLSELVIINCKHSTDLFFTSFYTNQVNSLTSIPHEPIV